IIVNQGETVAVGFLTGPTSTEGPGSPEVPGRQISFTSELIRKGIHLGSLSIPIGYYFIHRSTALDVLVPLTIFSIVIDVGRFSIPAIQRVVQHYFARILRPHERRP